MLSAHQLLCTELPAKKRSKN